MATDRLTSTSPSQAGQRVSNHVYHVQYCYYLRRGSERSERKPVIATVLCGLSIRRYVQRASTPRWGKSLPPRLYIPFQTFLPKFKDLFAKSIDKRSSSGCLFSYSSNLETHPVIIYFLSSGATTPR